MTLLTLAALALLTRDVVRELPKFPAWARSTWRGDKYGWGDIDEGDTE